MVRKDVLILISMLIVFVMAGMVSATDCWSTANSASESVCEANDDCQWKVDPWGSWCEQKKFDVNEDNYYDLSVKLDDINASSTGATFTIKSISELMPVTAEEDVEASPEEAVVEDVSGEVVAESAGEVAVEGRDWGKILVDLTWLWVTLALIIIAVIVGIIIHRRK